MNADERRESERIEGGGERQSATRGSVEAAIAGRKTAETEMWAKRLSGAIECIMNSYPDRSGKSDHLYERDMPGLGENTRTSPVAPPSDDTPHQ